MIPVSLQRLTEILDAKLLGADCQITQVSIDTRKITPGCLFIALKGERFDGHDFASAALSAGAGALLVSRPLAVDAPQLIVGDTRLALGALAAWVRQQISARIVALTGSSGKTTVKEMAAAILRQCGEVLSTEGNFNNDIGVPLTLLRLTPKDDFAVIELGANHIGEIAYTTALVRPHSALINNLTEAHLEGFGSLAGVAQAKGEIFQGLAEDGIAIINADSHDWQRWASAVNGKKVWRFSAVSAKDVDFYVSDVQVKGYELSFTMHTPYGEVALSLAAPGRHNIANALAAAALAISVGAPLKAVRDGLQQLKPVAGRLFPIRLAPSKLLLDDSYNANVGSMVAAANVLAEMPGYRVMVVGDMAELGNDARECHQKVGLAVSQAGIDKVLSVGALSQLISSATQSGEHLQNKEAVIARIMELLAEYEVITLLIKGSRSAAMEQVVHALQEKKAC